MAEGGVPSWGGDPLGSPGEGSPGEGVPEWQKEGSPGEGVFDGRRGSMLVCGITNVRN